MSMILTYIQGYEPLVWVYIFSTVLTAIASGLFFLRFRLVMEDRIGCFLCGFAFCPCLQYLWTMLLTPLVNGGSRYFYIVSLPLLSLGWIVFLVLYKEKSVTVISVKRWNCVQKGIAFILFIIFGITVAHLVFYFLKAATSSSFVYSDNLEYFLKASYFADNRTLSSISYVNGVPDGSGVADHHFPSYVLYLGYAFMHTMATTIQFPHHGAPLLAAFFQLPFILAAAGGAFCAVGCRKVWLLLLPSLLFGNSVFANGIWISTRDLFRFTLLFLFLASMISFSQEKWEVRTRGRHIFFLVLSFLCASAHLLNFVIVCLLLLAWVAYRLFSVILFPEKGEKLNAVVVDIIIWASATFSSATLSFVGNIYYFLKSGKWGAQRLDLSGYDFYPEYNALINGEGVEIPPIGERLVKSLQLDENFLAMFFFFLMALILGRRIFWVIRKKYFERRGERQLLFLALCVFFTFLPLSGMLDHERIYLFSVYFAQHPRYGLGFFFCGILLMLTAAAESVDFLLKKNKWIFTSGAVCVAGCLCGYTLYQYHDTITNFNNIFASHYGVGDTRFLERFGELREVVFKLDSERVLCTQQIGYALEGKNIQHLSPLVRPLYEAEGETELKEAFKELGIGAVVLPKTVTSESPISLMPWYDYATQFPVVPAGDYQVYDFTEIGDVEGEGKGEDDD